ncbi:MAG: endonuclease/exonuclease/phosphatase family protein [Lysobacterales bacterium]|jgi:hypothetical protein
MPFYTWLRPHEGDSKRRLQTKKRAADKIRALRSAFETHLAQQAATANTEPPKDPTKVLRLATWNLREFDAPSYGKRSEEAMSYIAEIVSFFDLVAIQEVRRDLTAVNSLQHLLGPNWSYIATDVTEGASGNKERMAFLYNRNRVWFRDVAGELTLPHGHKVTDPFGERFGVAGGAELNLPPGSILSSPPDVRHTTLASGDIKLKEDVEIPLPANTRLLLPPNSALRFAKNARVPLNSQKGIDIPASQNPHLPDAAEIVLPPGSVVGGPKQFARTPYIASFQSGWLKLNLATVHIYYGQGDAGLERRKEEIRRLTKLLADRAASDSDSDADAYFIALGDFNIVGKDHETMAALITNEFEVPAPLQTVPGSNVKRDKFYDQIALWTGKSNRRKSYTRLRTYRAGVFDYFDTVFRNDEEAIYHPFMRKPDNPNEFYSSYTTWRTYQMSDHLPMWIELHIDFAEEYLDEVDAELQAKLGQP